MRRNRKLSKRHSGFGSTTAHEIGIEHIHAPDGWRGYGNTYDKNGNATRVDHDLNWYDVENRFSQVNYIPNSTTYLYDASGEMVRRKVDNLFEDPGTEAKETFFDGLYRSRARAAAPLRRTPSTTPRSAA